MKKIKLSSNWTQSSVLKNRIMHQHLNSMKKSLKFIKPTIHMKLFSSLMTKWMPVFVASIWVTFKMPLSILMTPLDSTKNWWENKPSSTLKFCIL